MSFLELVQKRQSTRLYSPRPVEKEKIERCLEAARLAPSASNSQPWTFIIVDDPELRQKIARETYSAVVPFNKFAKDAPIIVVIVVERSTLITQLGGRIKQKDFALYDIGIVAEHFCLQAADDDLGTCMLGWFNEKRIRELLKLPAKRTVGLLITLGYPVNGQIRDKKRKSPQEFSRYNSYE